MRTSDVVLPQLHREPDDLRARPPVEYPDMPAIRAIVSDAAKNNNRMSHPFVLGVVNSGAFRMSERRRDDLTSA